jgi:hypothetical protein
MMQGPLFFNPLKLHSIAVESVQYIETHTQRTHSHTLQQTYNYTPPNQPRPLRDHQKTLVHDEDVALLFVASRERGKPKESSPERSRRTPPPRAHRRWRAVRRRHGGSPGDYIPNGHIAAAAASMHPGQQSFTAQKPTRTRSSPEMDRKSKSLAAETTYLLPELQHIASDSATCHPTPPPAKREQATSTTRRARPPRHQERHTTAAPPRHGRGPTRHREARRRQCHRRPAASPPSGPGCHA